MSCLYRRAATRSAALVFLVGLAFLCSSRPAAAAPIACSSGVRLSDLTRPGSEGCLLRDVLFTDFTYAFTAAGGAPEVDASDVWVATVGTRYALGLAFAADWILEPGQSLAAEISYSFSNLRRHRLRALTAGLGNVEPWFEQDAAALTTTVCLEDRFPCSAGTLVTLPPGGGALVSQHGGVRMSLLFDGGLLQGDGPATLDSVSTIFSVPEPSQLVLMLAGCAVLAARLRVGGFRPSR
jgi:hypothetical protein